MDWVIIGSGKGLRRTITWTNTDLIPINDTSNPGVIKWKHMFIN